MVSWTLRPRMPPWAFTSLAHSRYPRLNASPSAEKSPDSDSDAPMVIGPVGWLVAAVSSSPGNLPALRYAADLARARDVALTFVHAWMPAGPEFAAWQFPSDPLVLQWQDDAWQRLWRALDTAFGGLPPDLEVQPLVMRGNPGPVLVGVARRDGDGLVGGACRRGTFGRFRHGKGSRYCPARAGSPV